MKNLLKKLRHKAILYVFNRYFGNLVYGFETADAKLAKLEETQKIMYYERVTEWVESKAYEIEEKGKLEDCYARLATELVGDDLMAAYRVVMLVLKNNDIRLRSKVDEYTKIKAAKRAFSNINKSYGETAGN